MFDVTVRHTVPLPVGQVFTVLTDHAGYHRFPGIVSSRLVDSGTPSENGVGALRRIGLPGLVLFERITAYDVDAGYDYHIERTRWLPIQHTVGTVRLTVRPDGFTDVEWRSAGRVPLPGVGRLWDRALTRMIPRLFKKILCAIPLS